VRAPLAATLSAAILTFASAGRAEVDARGGMSTPSADPLAASSVGPAGSVDPVTAWLGDPIPPDPSAPHHVGPILLVGVGGGLGGSDTWLVADLGFRIDRFTGRAAWRMVSLGGDYLEGWNGRLGFIALERRFVAVHGALGAGRLTRSYSDARASASGTVGTLDLGVLLFPRWSVGPVFSVSLEAIAPVGSGVLGGPTVAVYGTMNLLALLLTPL
jgi:hypothetical protein